jgi:hypothetical protein
MRIRRDTAIACCAIFVCVAMAGHAAAQEPTSLVTSAKGEGKIKIGKEEFKLHAVVVKLFEDGKAELNLITDITVLITGTWSRAQDAERTIDLKITGSVTGGNLSGGGKIFVTADRKSISSLKLQVFNKTSRRTVTAEFTVK